MTIDADETNGDNATGKPESGSAKLDPEIEAVFADLHAGLDSPTEQQLAVLTSMRKRHYARKEMFRRAEERRKTLAPAEYEAFIDAEIDADIARVRAKVGPFTPPKPVEMPIEEQRAFLAQRKERFRARQEMFRRAEERRKTLAPAEYEALIDAEIDAMIDRLREELAQTTHVKPDLG